jgi:hypothetical protein
MNLFNFIIKQIRYDGIFYFLVNRKDCMNLCRNQLRLWDKSNNPANIAASERHAECLLNAGEIGHK